MSALTIAASTLVPAILIIWIMVSHYRKRYGQNIPTGKAFIIAALALFVGFAGFHVGLYLAS